MATSVVLVVVPGVVDLLLSNFRIPKTFSISQPIAIKLRKQIGNNTLHSRTVSHFQVKS